MNNIPIVELNTFTNTEVLKDIIDSYQAGESLRSIAARYATDHHRIVRILNSHNISIRPRSPAKAKQLKFGGNTKNVRYNNIKTHLRFDIELEWFQQFEDIDKLIFLNRQVVNKDKTRFAETAEWYKAFIEKFYFDEQFNKLYDKYKESGDKYMKPSLDHIIPRSAGGTNEISNLRFLTFLENMCKRDIPAATWEKIKQRLDEYFIL